MLLNQFPYILRLLFTLLHDVWVKFESKQYPSIPPKYDSIIVILYIYVISSAKRKEYAYSEYSIIF